jgi:hypothetical protein
MISKMSSTMKRDGPIGERLLEQGKERDERKRFVANRYAENAVEDQPFKPQVNEISAMLSEGTS